VLQSFRRRLPVHANNASGVTIAATESHGIDAFHPASVITTIETGLKRHAFAKRITSTDGCSCSPRTQIENQ